MRAKALFFLFVLTQLTGCSWFFGTTHTPSTDKDGDGIRDYDDRCMDTPGVVELKGCPDVNHNGVADVDERLNALQRVHSLDELKEVLQRSNGTALVLFSARWCGPCMIVERYWHEHSPTHQTPVVLWHDESVRDWQVTPDFEEAYKLLLGHELESVPACVALKGATTWPPNNTARVALGDDIKSCTTRMTTTNPSSIEVITPL